MHSLNEHLQLTCRRLFVRNHTVQARIGAHDFEQGVSQRLVLNVELFVPLATSTPSADALSEVVDYDYVRHTIAQRLAQGHITLQETLVDELAAQLLAHPGVQAVRVSSAKPDVYPDCDAVGVEVFRHKSTA